MRWIHGMHSFAIAGGRGGSVSAS